MEPIFRIDNCKMSAMNDRQAILREIVRLTSNIETNYPELYRHLDENPMTIPSSPHPNLGVATLGEYLDYLKQLLKHHQLQTH
jgi:hypothetical protein